MIKLGWPLLILAKKLGSLTGNNLASKIKAKIKPRIALKGYAPMKQC
jgi:hypothetical protein